MSYISDGWGRRINDKYLTEHRTLLIVMVVLTSRLRRLLLSSLKIPALTKGENQLSGIEVEQTTRIANVRIHVEYQCHRQH